MNTSRIKSNIAHYYCSIYASAEDAVTIGLLVAFSAFSLFPSQALAYSSMVDKGDAGMLNFIVPYGPGQQALTGVKPSSPDSITFTPNMYLSVWTSAYSSTVGQTDADPFTTASGTHVHVGTAASNILPLGTEILMNGKPYTIEDHMNARYNNRYAMDIWQPSQEAAFAFGVRLMTIKIVSLP